MYVLISAYSSTVGMNFNVPVFLCLNYTHVAGTRVNVTGPENIKHVLITHRHKYAKSKTIKLFVPSVGNGILSCSHEDHVRQHKMVAPAFSYNNLKDMTTIFKEVACKLVQVFVAKLTHGSL